MYCPTCGAPTAPGLKYCNRCGANLARSDGPQSPRLGGLAWALPLAVGVVTLAGLGALFVVAMEFAGRSSGLSTEAAAVMLAGFLAVFAVDWLLIRQLSRVIDIYH
ncbi:MAG TPA: zinc ribbon domain-containing protein, partial [Pyrinomonadaceae bacterium]|nr:zinc ribbon domain-containing protein [Pyrinomonadaceae bacterium]